MSINSVAISGNLTRDSELRALANGTSVLTFGVAVNERVKNQQTGEWEDRPNFVDCAIFGARADALQRYLVKGARVAVTGRLRWSSWEKNGQKRSKLEVIADNVDLAPRANEGQSDGSNQQARPTYPDADSEGSQPYYSAPQTYDTDAHW